VSRDVRFTFRLSLDERQLLMALAAQFNRTESNVVRWLIREAARELGLGRAPPNDVLSAAFSVQHEGEHDGKSDPAV
jgi:hypothetical protein